MFSPLAQLRPCAHALFKEVYKRAQKNGRWAMASGQPGVHTTWSTLCASKYWDKRPGIAGAAKDAEVQSNILLRYQTRNLVVVGRRDRGRAPEGVGGRAGRRRQRVRCGRAPGTALESMLAGLSLGREI